MIAIGSDHAAVNFKAKIVEHLQKRGIDCIDVGADPSVTASDYPDYAELACKKVLEKKAKFAIIVCGTGIGMSMAANKMKGIRCALCGDTFSAKATRSHNDANVLALGERVLGLGLALDIVDAFIDTEFSNIERHVMRINKITAIENGGSIN